jgi:ABC-2 type transport system permease protein
MEFRVDFFFRILMDIVFYIVNIFFFKVIFLHSDLLAGWTESQVMIFVAGFLVIDALNMTVFSNNSWWLPIFVNRGDLDYYLVRPVSPFFFLSFRDFAANSFVNLIMAVGILVWSLTSYAEPLAWSRVFAFVLLLINGTVLYHLINMLTLLPVFWIHSGRGLQQIFWNLSKFMERPDRIFRGWLRVILVTVLPFSIVASFPARILFEDSPGTLIVHILGVTIAFSVVMSVAWALALRAYSSASS